MTDYDDNLYTQHPSHRKRVVEPLPGQTGRDDPTPNPAVDLIRQKIDNIYGQEPSAKEELQEVESIGVKHSKHQQFMKDLGQSGKSLVEIQTAWHNYYMGLPDNEKHQVWQEFYAEHSKADQALRTTPTHEHKPKHHAVQDRPHDTRTVSDIKQQLVGNIQKRSRAKKRGHLHSLAFGLAMGSVVVLIMLFGFFNERIIAPFITPSRTISSTPIITDLNSTNVGLESKIIIPKINVEIPVVYDEPSVAENDVQKALERGVLHYATTPGPGETGNGVIFGHSSNNILNQGKYKFAFVLLSRLEDGDTFMLHKGGKRYVYKVYDKKVVPPTDLSVLGKASGKAATFTLITCDPPGTSINRLVVVGEQVTPDPNANVASTAKPIRGTRAPAILPSNSPSLWERFTSWLSG